MSAIHFVIPDTQAKPDVPTSHLRWIGQYLVDQLAGKDNVKVIHLGDHWDMPSLSSYDKGKRAMEGRRYVADVHAGNEAWKILNAPLEAYNAQRAATKHKQWWPERHLLRGNHEDRINRAANDDAQLDGLVTMDDLESPGWTVHDFLKPVCLDGVWYSHYWQARGAGRPLGGTARRRLDVLGHSFTQGHQQTYDPAVRYVAGRQQRGLVAGACYLHDEDYLGHQGNAHWRGLVVKHQVSEGEYDLMEISLDYLCRRYEGVPVAQWLRERGYDHYSLAQRDG